MNNDCWKFFNRKAKVIIDMTFPDWENIGQMKTAASKGDVVEVAVAQALYGSKKKSYTFSCKGSDYKQFINDQDIFDKYLKFI